MTSRAAALKQQIEIQLARRIPAALSPLARQETLRQPFTDPQLTALLRGGVPSGAITEVHGAASSGRTSVALSLVAAMTTTGNVAAWVDVTDSFDPETAAVCGVDLDRLLWVRCASATTYAQPTVDTPTAKAQVSTDLVAANHAPRVVGGGGSPHPRAEGKGMAEAIDALLHAQPSAAAVKQRRAQKVGTPGAPNRDVMAFPHASPYREEQIATDRQPSRRTGVIGSWQKPSAKARELAVPPAEKPVVGKTDEWKPLDQALRAMDLLLQAGGFSLLVLDLGDVPTKVAWRIPLATWFRFRAGCEQSRAALLVISQHPCARASAGMTVAATFADKQSVGGTVVTGSTIRLNVEQQRRNVERASNIVAFRKPVRSADQDAWTAASTWSIRA